MQQSNNLDEDTEKQDEQELQLTIKIEEMKRYLKQVQKEEKATSEALKTKKNFNKKLQNASKCLQTTHVTNNNKLRQLAAKIETEKSLDDMIYGKLFL